MRRDYLKSLADELVALRHDLHRTPELAHEEHGTAARLAGFLQAAGAVDLRTGLGTTGLAAVFEGGEPGPTVLFRCELDGLPIQESRELAYASEHEGRAHKCGHDGHMAICAGLGALLASTPPRHGRVVVLFQPAEETGEGMERVLEDPGFADLAPDAAFALHNLPGFPLGAVVLREGAFAWGSVGLSATLLGKTSHAAYPEHGNSPARALGALLSELDRLGPAATQGLATVIHARVGAAAFGTAPGEAELMVTLRAPTQAGLDAFRDEVDARIREMAARYHLSCESGTTEPFPPTHNHRWCVEIARDAVAAVGLELVELSTAFRWSEDFGHLAARYPAALIGLGAGTKMPQLHHPAYDFDDHLLEPGVRLLNALVEEILDGEHPMEVPCSSRR